MKDTKLFVVLPCYNEEECAGGNLKALAGIIWEND